MIEYSAVVSFSPYFPMIKHIIAGGAIGLLGSVLGWQTMMGAILFLGIMFLLARPLDERENSQMQKEEEIRPYLLGRQ